MPIPVSRNTIVYPDCDDCKLDVVFSRGEFKYFLQYLTLRLTTMMISSCFYGRHSKMKRGSCTTMVDRSLLCYARLSPKGWVVPDPV